MNFRFFKKFVLKVFKWLFLCGLRWKGILTFIDFIFEFIFMQFLCNWKTKYFSQGSPQDNVFVRINAKGQSSPGKNANRDKFCLSSASYHSMLTPMLWNHENFFEFWWRTTVTRGTELMVSCSKYVSWRNEDLKTIIAKNHNYLSKIE